MGLDLLCQRFSSPDFYLPQLNASESRNAINDNTSDSNNNIALIVGCVLGVTFLIIIIIVVILFIFKYKRNRHSTNSDSFGNPTAHQTLQKNTLHLPPKSEMPLTSDVCYAEINESSLAPRDRDGVKQEHEASKTKTQSSYFVLDYTEIIFPNDTNVKMEPSVFNKDYAHAGNTLSPYEDASGFGNNEPEVDFGSQYAEISDTDAASRASKALFTKCESENRTSKSVIQETPALPEYAVVNKDRKADKVQSGNSLPVYARPLKTQTH